MKRWQSWSLLIAGCAISMTTLASQGGGFGPPQWTQYRLNSTHNAVYDNGAEALPRTKYRTGGQVRATPVIVGDSLYVGNHATGGMFRFDLASGRVIWGASDPWFRHAPNWIHADMIQADGRIFVGYGNRMFQSPQLRGTGSSGVMAVDPESGATLWKHATLGEVMPTPTFYDGTLYAVTGAGKLIALAPDSGELLWSLELPGWVSMSSPVIDDGMLYVGALNAVVAVDLASHEIRWTFEEEASFTDVPPAISDGIVVITAKASRRQLSKEQRQQYSTQRGDFHFIYAFDAESGKLLWRDLLGSGAPQDNNTSGAPAIANGHVYVGSPYTYSVFSYDLHSGQRAWEYPVGAKVKGAPAIANGKVLFGDTAGFLHLLDAKTGTPPSCENGRSAGKLKLGGSSNNSKAVALAPGGPVVINDTVFVGSQDGFVYAVPIAEIGCH